MYQETPIITSIPKANISTTNTELIGEKTNSNTFFITLAILAIAAIASSFYLKNKINKETTENNYIPL